MSDDYESNEGFVEREDGTRDDWAFHAPILDNPEADRKIQERAVQRAIDRGAEVARRIWGP